MKAIRSKFLMIIVTLATVICLYILVSLWLLEGKLIYHTTYKAESIAVAKEKNMVLSDKIKVIYGSENKLVNDYFSNSSLWFETHSDIMYFGILFKNKRMIPGYCKLRAVSSKSYNDYCCDLLINDELKETKVTFPYDGMALKQGDTLTCIIYSCQTDEKLGGYKILASW